MMFLTAQRNAQAKQTIKHQQSRYEFCGSIVI